MKCAESGRIAPRRAHEARAWLALAVLAIVIGLLLFVPAGSIRYRHAVGFFLIWIVYRQNTFTSATVEIAQNQTVISTGPYAIVRHPMYASALLYFVGTPLALGSYWGAGLGRRDRAISVVATPDEERLLADKLQGYAAYQQRVRYRLVPFVW